VVVRLFSGAPPNAATMWDACRRSERPSSECDASSKNNSDRLCAARALTVDIGTVDGDALGVGNSDRASNSLSTSRPGPLAFAQQRDHVRHRVDPADQQFHGDIDIEPWRSVRVTIDWITARMFLTR